MIKTCKRCGNTFETNNKHRGRCNDCVNNNLIDETQVTQKSDKYSQEKWFKEELGIVEDSFKKGKSYEDIAKEVNAWRQERTDICPCRTPRAVVFQAKKLKLITNEELEEWDKQNTLNLSRLRGKSKKKVREIILARDNNECVYCKSKEKLEMAHIVPFNKTKENNEMECVILCKKHHGLFDGSRMSYHPKQIRVKLRVEITKFIYDLMIYYYPDYSKNYELVIESCNSCGYHCDIIKIK